MDFVDGKIIKLIITDFDGVILESESAKDQAFYECFSIFPEHVEEFVAYHRNNPIIGRYEKFEYFYKKILKRRYAEDDKKFISKRFNDIVFEKVVASPFVLGALNFLKTYSKFVPIWVVTGTPKKELLRVLKALNLEQYFQKVSSIPPHKSLILANILKETGLEPENTIYIGDMNNDLKAAQENHIPFIARRNKETFEGPRISEIDNFILIHKILSVSDNNHVLLEVNNYAQHKKLR